MKKITKRVSAVVLTAALARGAVSIAAYAVNIVKIKSDVTGDGKGTQADAVLAARKEDGRDIGNTAFDEVAADVDTNGTFDGDDVTAIANYLVYAAEGAVLKDLYPANGIQNPVNGIKDRVNQLVQFCVSHSYPPVLG